ncbi:unnamed protein product [Mytilus edulis]|uniref:Calcium channel flower n=1 Tax=Mytilus edulis TaxID=6550 RepID=A0A8S3Q6N2_MYTED|nr:unnamed protein product [Mytilus edulis]
MERPNQQQQQGDQVAWWFKILARAVGTIGGLVAMATGVVVCISFSAICILAGVLQIFIGFVAVIFEAPCCCQFLDFTDKIGKFSENRPYWQKAVTYCILGLIPIITCFSTSTVFGSGLVFAAGVVYGLMAIGKKADRDTMLSKAKGDDVELGATLLENEQKVDLHVPESPGKS